MPVGPDLLVQCIVALVTFVLGWILPTPKYVARALLQARAMEETAKIAKPDNLEHLAKLLLHEIREEKLKDVARKETHV